MTRLHFPADRILNSPVIDTATEEVMYEVKSKAITGSRDIRLRTAIHDVKKNEVVAVWERTHSIERGEDWITYHSATSDGILSDWLPQLGQFSPKCVRLVSLGALSMTSLTGSAQGTTLHRAQ